MNKKIELEIILAEIEYELRSLELWQEKRPPEQAFRSDEPFFMNTMEFHEWLQFVLIERLRAMIENNDELPNKVALFPYAFEVYKYDKSTKMKLLKLIYKFDSIFRE